MASVLICVAAGCSTLSPVTADPAGERIRAEIRAGDTVHVRMADGAAHRLRVSTVGESSLAGDALRTKGSTDAAGSHLELAYRDIRQIEVERVSGFRTTAIVAGLVLAAAVAIATGGGSHTPGYTR
jgi:hypothetical protein